VEDICLDFGRDVNVRLATEEGLVMGASWYDSNCKVGSATSLRICARKGLAVAA
jgi:hypothetical protein